MIFVLLPEYEHEEERQAYEEKETDCLHAGDDEAVAGMDAARPRIVDQAPRRIRPEIGRCALAECPLIALQRFGIALEMMMPLRRAPRRGLVMQLPAEHLGAEALPIIAAVGEVQMPGLVDGVGGRDLVACGRGEEAEALIFTEDPRCPGRAPAILAREPRLERQSGVFRADSIIAEGHPDRVFAAGNGRTVPPAHLSLPD